MVEVLQSQLHFVRGIQSVETTGVEPLRSIRDETEDGMREATVGVAQLHEALENEAVHGHSRRPRMRKPKTDAAVVENWDVLGTASQKKGRYFVVRSGKSVEGA